jgi:hypothetical protein
MSAMPVGDTDMPDPREPPAGSASPDDDHPVWCARAECEVTSTRPGTHRSHPVRVDPTPPSPLRATVVLTRGPQVPRYPGTGVTLVELEFSDGDGELCIVIMYGSMAHNLGRILAHCGRTAERE